MYHTARHGQKGPAPRDLFAGDPGVPGSSTGSRVDELPFWTVRRPRTPGCLTASSLELTSKSPCREPEDCQKKGETRGAPMILLLFRKCPGSPPGEPPYSAVPPDRRVIHARPHGVRVRISTVKSFPDTAEEWCPAPSRSQRRRARGALPPTDNS